LTSDDVARAEDEATERAADLMSCLSGGDFVAVVDCCSATAAGALKFDDEQLDAAAVERSRRSFSGCSSPRRQFVVGVAESGSAETRCAGGRPLLGLAGAVESTSVASSVGGGVEGVDDGAAGLTPSSRRLPR